MFRSGGVIGFARDGYVHNDADYTLLVPQTEAKITAEDISLKTMQLIFGREVAWKGHGTARW